MMCERNSAENPSVCLGKNGKGYMQILKGIMDQKPMAIDGESLTISLDRG